MKPIYAPSLKDTRGYKRLYKKPYIEPEPGLSIWILPLAESVHKQLMATNSIP